MPPKPASSRSVEADEFDDDGFDWNAAVDTLAETEEKVKAATEHAAVVSDLSLR